MGEQALQHAVHSSQADSMSALRGSVNYSSMDARINSGARELALDSSAFPQKMRIFQHIPGFTNFLADCLSRLTAPAGSRKPFPVELREVAQSTVATRDSQFWKTWELPT